MTSVNVTTQKNTVTVQQGDATTVTVTTQGAQGADGAGISAGDKGALTVAANLTDWTLNDSVVTNAKVSASAAIAGTKISPDFGSQNITTTGNAVFGGNLTVSGTTTTIDTTTLTVEDKNIELGKVGSPTDITADGGGITLLGDTNHTFNWLNATDSWTSSEHIALPDNKKLQLGDSQDLQIFHTGSVAKIINDTGNFNIQGNSIRLFNQAGNEFYITCTANAGVDLYHDGTKKAETTSTGFDVTGTLKAINKVVIHDNGTSTPMLQLTNSVTGTGTEDGFRIGYSTNSNVAFFIAGESNSAFQIKTGGSAANDERLNISNTGVFTVKSNSENMLVATPNAGVELYYNGTKQAETLTDGFQIQDNLTISSTNPKLIFDETSSNNKYRFEEGSGRLQLKISNNGGVAYHSAISIGGVGNIFIPDNDKVNFGDGNDLTIVHDSTDSKITNKTGNLLIEAKDSETGIKVIPDGAIELYHDNVLKADTQSWGFFVRGSLVANGDLKVNKYSTGGKLKIGEQGEFTIHHDDTDSFIENTVGNLHIRPKASEEGIKLIPDGAVELFHNGTKKAETSSTGWDVSGKLEVLHPNTNTFSEIKCNGGVSGLRISGSAAASAAFLTFANNHINTLTDRWTFGTANDGASSDMVVYLGSGVTGTERLRVKGDSARVDFSCDLRPEADNTRALGSSSKRFSTLHSAALNTGDINMSNLNDSPNEVDGSKGSWTLQEGADDLFIINRVSGKKYKFNLTEIS